MSPRAVMLNDVLVPRACLGAPLSLALVLLATRSRAEPSRVALVSAAQPDALVADVTSRMNAELTASGFDVVIVPPPDDGDVRAAVELARTEPGVVATFAVVSMGRQAAVDVWLSDRITGKTTVKRLDPGPVAARGPAVLAIRAVELLRASLLETLVPPADPAAAPPAPVPHDVSHFVEAKSHESRARRPWPGVTSFGAGIGALNGFGGLGPAMYPIVRFAYALRADTFVRATIGGPSLGLAIQSTTGSATTRQEFGLIELAYAWPIGTSVQIVASGGAGVYHLQVQGSALPPFGGDSPQLWSPLFDVGVGGAFRLGEHSGILLDLHALVTQRQARVVFADGESKTSGRPIGAATLGLWSAF